MRKFDNNNVGLSQDEIRTLRKLNTPEKIQDYISALGQNFELEGETTMSVRETLRAYRAHCIEAAFVAACAFWVNGDAPLLMDLRAEEDSDHVVALFRREGYWGSVSKSNHSVVRFRDPIYKSLRELALSYVHEYYNEKGKKTLRSYSRSFDLSLVEPGLWITSGTESWEVGAMLDDIRHYPLMTKAQSKRLRPLDEIETAASQLREHDKP